MSRSATKWAYSPTVNKSCLKPCERALLRALCWKANPKNFNQTDFLTDKDLMQLTGYKSHASIIKARRRLKQLGLIMHDPMRELGQSESCQSGYRYFILYEHVEEIRPDGAKKEYR